MSSTELFTLQPNNFQGNPVSTIWPVWRDSVVGKVQFAPQSKKAAQKLWFKARNWDRRTRVKHKHGGVIGRSALAVFYSLIHDFLNFASGRLDPSVKAIANAASISERTAYTALKRLKSLGLLNWIRRCARARDEEGHFVLRQSTNAYCLIAQTQWYGYRDEEPPAPSWDTLGCHPPLRSTIESASHELATGTAAQAYRDLMSDQGDRLAVALASLGRAMGRI